MPFGSQIRGEIGKIAVFELTGFGRISPQIDPGIGQTNGSLFESLNCVRKMKPVPIPRVKSFDPVPEEVGLMKEDPGQLTKTCPNAVRTGKANIESGTLQIAMESLPERRTAANV